MHQELDQHRATVICGVPYVRLRMEPQKQQGSICQFGTWC